MKRAIIAATMLLGSVFTANADQMIFSWHDMIRPHGHPRSDDVFDAAVNACNERAGIQEDTVSQAYKDCMRGFNYRWQFARLQRTPDIAANGGRVCSAKILQIEDTDWTLNDYPIARISLRITPPGGRSYETTVEKPVSRVNPPRSGSVLRVMCDPANPADVHPVN